MALCKQINVEFGYTVEGSCVDDYTHSASGKSGVGVDSAFVALNQELSYENWKP